jgi:hypothetical protein
MTPVIRLAIDIAMLVVNRHTCRCGDRGLSRIEAPQ